MTIQLQFNLDNETPENIKLDAMQKQIDVMSESVGKVRKKMFAELGEVKKIMHILKTENETLKQEVRLLKGEKIEWLYPESEYLFAIKEG